MAYQQKYDWPEELAVQFTDVMEMLYNDFGCPAEELEEFTYRTMDMWYRLTELGNHTRAIGAAMAAFEEMTYNKLGYKQTESWLKRADWMGGMRMTPVIHNWEEEANPNPEHMEWALESSVEDGIIQKIS